MIEYHELDDCTDVVYYINDINNDLASIGMGQINIHDEVNFNDYSFIMRIFKRWVIKNYDLNTFNDIIQDKIMKNKHLSNDIKDDICCILQQRKNKPHPFW